MEEVAAQAVDRERALREVTAQWRNLKNASSELQNDEEVVLAAVSQTGMALEFASQVQEAWGYHEPGPPQRAGTPRLFPEELRGNRRIVRRALSHTGAALAFASEELQDDAELVNKAVSSCGGSLRFASQRLKNNKDTVMAAVSQDGFALSRASSELQNSRDVALAAVTQDGRALQYVAEELRGDPEIVLAAVANNSYATLFATEEVLQDPIVIKTVCDDEPHFRFARVAMLSGKSCTIASKWPDLSGEKLLELSCEKLGIKDEAAARRGQLLLGNEMLASGDELVRGELNEVTLIIPGS